MSASASKSDLVMMFVDKNGGPVWAESTLGVLKTDPLMKGFNGIDSYNDYSNFFEVTSFNFDMQLNPADQGVGALSQPAQATQSSVAQAAPDQFSAWRSAEGNDYKMIKFPVDFDTFSFTRIIDGATPLFFAACCNQISFHHAALVKRVAAGSVGGKEQQSVGILRLDFRHVLLTGINWEDGDLVTESITFICKAMRVRYAPQMQSGEVMPAVEVDWDQAKDGSATSSGAS